MSTLQERIAELTSDMPRGWKARLAKHCNVSAPSVSDWASGETKTLEGSNLLRAAAFFKVHPSWLESGKSPKYLSDTNYSNVKEVGTGLTKIPLISYIQAGLWTEILENYQMDDNDDGLLTDQRVSKHAFALEIIGQSMLPEFKEGDRVIIDPDVAPQPGDFVAAKNGGEEATFKKYRPRGTGADGNTIFELVPLNEDFPSLRSDMTAIRIVGTMVEHRKYRRPR